MHTNTSIIALSTLLLSAGAATSANAVIIDFEQFAHDTASAVSLGSLVQEDGFSILANPENPRSGDNELYVLGSLLPTYPGSAALLLNANSGLFTITQDNGEAFDFESIDLGRIIDGDSIDIAVSGMTADSQTVSTSLQLDSTGQTTFYLGDAFNNVVSVQMQQASISANAYHFDNVTLQEVPGLGGLALAGAGFAASMTGRRRKG